MADETKTTNKAADEKKNLKALQELVAAEEAKLATLRKESVQLEQDKKDWRDKVEKVFMCIWKLRRIGAGGSLRKEYTNLFQEFRDYLGADAEELERKWNKGG